MFAVYLTDGSAKTHSIGQGRGSKEPLVNRLFMFMFTGVGRELNSDETAHAYTTYYVIRTLNADSSRALMNDDICSSAETYLPTLTFVLGIQQSCVPIRLVIDLRILIVNRAILCCNILFSSLK